jgi:hypothetical protein
MAGRVGTLTQSSVPILPTFPDVAAMPSNRWSLTMFVWDIALLSNRRGVPRGRRTALAYAVSKPNMR